MAVICPPVQKTGVQVRMDAVTILHEDRLFSSEPTTRAISRRLYQEVRNLPLLSPHGHTEARWFADNEPFPDPTTLLIIPDHYVFRMLYSQGIAMEDLGIGKKELSADEARKIWRRARSAWNSAMPIMSACRWRRCCCSAAITALRTRS